jgi:DNA-binding transcriptional ArsR family regulator
VADHCDLLCLDLLTAEVLRGSRLPVEVAEAASRRAHALSDPTRLTLAAALRDDIELCVCDLSWIVERAQNLVSHHMRVLRQAGFVVARRDGKMVMYSLTADGRVLVESALATAGAPT